MDRDGRIEALKGRAMKVRARLDREEIERENAKAAERAELDRVKQNAANFVRCFEQAVKRLNSEISASGFQIQTGNERKIAKVGSLEERQAKLPIEGDAGAYNVLAFAFHRTGQVFVQYYGTNPISPIRTPVRLDEADEEWVDNALIEFLTACLPE
jgi:hypothetical protein